MLIEIIQNIIISGFAFYGLGVVTWKLVKKYPMKQREE